MFYGKNFIFDGTPSEIFGVRIVNFETSSLQGSPSGADSTIYEKWLLKKQKSYFFGRALNTPLIITMTIGNDDPISGFDRGKIEQWLLGKTSYVKLQIEQDDIANCYYNCIGISASNQYIGNQMAGMVITFQCDSPWAWTFPKTVTRTFSGDALQDFYMDFYNDSDSNDYLYPIVSFSLNTIGTSFEIVNITDDDREFSFSGLNANEEIEVDNDKKIITSDSGLRRLSTFNKGWFRLVPGYNNLHIMSGIGTFSITYSLARKIGG